MIRLIHLLKEDSTLVSLEKAYDVAYSIWRKDKKNIRAKRGLDDATKQLVKYRKNLTHKSLNIPELKNIFKTYGLSSVTYQHSSVPGFKRANRETYEFPDKDNPKTIWLHTNQNKIKDIIDAMNVAGFDIQSHSGETITLK